ncbi:MAG: AraC family transcriptional regulator [Clostridia bacterium]|nr:AraC family transcriptional regulator [Clostridia bacterium]
MTVKEVADKLGLKILTGSGEKEIKGFYSCDLLSWVISHAGPGDMWVTVMNNINILAVASLVDVACIVIPEGVEIYENLAQRANEKGITILATDLSAADIIIKASDTVRGIA